MLVLQIAPAPAEVAGVAAHAAAARAAAITPAAAPVWRLLLPLLVCCSCSCCEQHCRLFYSCFVLCGCSFSHCCYCRLLLLLLLLRRCRCCYIGKPAKPFYVKSKKILQWFLCCCCSSKPCAAAAVVAAATPRGDPGGPTGTQGPHRDLAFFRFCCCRH